MSIQIEGLDNIEDLFIEIQNEAPKRVVKEMIAVAKDIQKLAVQMAPIDHGYLEEAIKLDVSGGRDDRGRFARQVVSVFVDQEMPAEGLKVVGDYAYFIHEHQTPMGPVPLGPRSQEKQRGTSVVVGGGYLERATQQIEEEVEERVSDKLRDYL